MGIRFSIPEILLSVAAAPGLSAYTKKDQDCKCRVKDNDNFYVVQNAAKSTAGKVMTFYISKAHS